MSDHLIHGAPAPQELIIWDIAERFGWTLDYIDGLSLARLHEYLQIADAKGKARDWYGRKNS